MGVKYPVGAAIFDLDGTVMDSMVCQYEVHKAVAMQIGGMKEFPPNDDAFWIAYNKAYKGGLSSLYGRYGTITEENFNDLYPAILQMYTAFLKTFPVSTVKVGDDDISDVIRTVWERGQITEKRDNRLRIAVNTTKEKQNAMTLLQRENLWQYFDTAVTMDDVVRYVADGPAKRLGLEELPTDINALRKLLSKDTMKSCEKPSSLSTMRTLGKLGAPLAIPYDSIVVFEDTPEGVLSCKNVIMPDQNVDLYVVGVLWGYERDPEELKKAGADLLIKTPSEIIDVLDKFGGFS